MVITPKEQQVLVLIYECKTDKEIACLLHRAQKTIEKRKVTLYKKFQVHTNVELIRKLCEDENYAKFRSSHSWKCVNWPTR